MRLADSVIISRNNHETFVQLHECKKNKVKEENW